MQLNDMNQVKRTLVTDSLKVKKAIANCTTLAENGSDEYKNLEIRIMSEGILISSTDGARHLQYSVPNNTSANDIVCVNAKRLNSIIPTDKVSLTMQIRSRDIVIEEGGNTMQLKTFPPLNLDIMKDMGYSEKVGVNAFITQLEALIPLVQGDSQHSYVLISKGYIAVQQTLMMGVSEVKSLANTYVLDTFTAKMILTLCKQLDNRDTESVYFHKDPSDAFTVVKIGNARLKFATIQSDEINLDEVSRMKKVSGFLVNRPSFVDALTKIQTVTDSVDVDIRSLTDKVALSPALEEYRDTIFKLDATELTDKPDDKTHISATVNIETIKKALKSFKQNAVYIVPSYENVLILFDANKVTPIRYFISII